MTQGRQSLPEETRGDYGVAHVPNLLFRWKETKLTDIEWENITRVRNCPVLSILNTLFGFLLFAFNALKQGQQGGGNRSWLRGCLPPIYNSWTPGRKYQKKKKGKVRRAGQRKPEVIMGSSASLTRYISLLSFHLGGNRNVETQNLSSYTYLHSSWISTYWISTFWR